MIRESLTIDVAALVREGDQHLAYAIERPLRTGHIHPQPYDVPEEKEHDSERSDPAQHRAFGPSKKCCITAQKFPQAGYAGHRILSSCKTDCVMLQRQGKPSQLPCLAQQRQKLSEIP